MLEIKIVIYTFIFLSCSLIGILISKKYANRVNELKEFKNALNIFKTKIRYTYEPIPDIFMQISENVNSNIGNVLENLSKLLGKTDLQGQLNQIEMTEDFLNEQIRKAEQEKNKNEKMYRTLGAIIGMVIVIIVM